ncbi:MAG: hypothetical protein CMJ30_03850 [Phycisphaerae bacterium]|jgi:prepilin-type N-terminal cleavage/methylation domain-containing protein|nr:hypothetical protein [Phycisphaerae bacterium]
MHKGASSRIPANRGFSLVELVVALGVGLTILALVFPALSEARTLAVRSVTQSNLRQIGVATHAYAQARSGKLPNSLPAEVGRYGWLNLVRLPKDTEDARWDGFGLLYINGYTDTGEIFHAPTVEGEPTWTHDVSYRWATPRPDETDPLACSYDYCGDLRWESESLTHRRTRRIDDQHLILATDAIRCPNIGGLGGFSVLRGDASVRWCDRPVLAAQAGVLAEDASFPAIWRAIIDAAH